MPDRGPRAGRGFTLIELLVVCAIAGITLSFLLFSTGILGGRSLEDATESLAQRLETIRDEAVISGQILGFSSDGKGYQFWRLDGENKTWNAWSRAGDLAAREFPGGVVLSAMSINGSPRPLGERIIFHPSGTGETFSLTLDADKSRMKLAADVLGRLEISREVTE